MNNYSFRLYGRQAEKLVRTNRHSARIYHYRAGLGHESVATAKELGMIALCDHSIAHPAVLEHLVAHQGQLPPPGIQGAMGTFWAGILHDIEQSDAVVVNSDFVKETFVHQGWDPARVHVIYWGPDEQFFGSIPQGDPRENGRDATMRMLFAGTLEQRKGATTLLSAVGKLGDAPWRLEIAGMVDPGIRHALDRELCDPRITVSGLLPRRELASRMVAADLFIFPSLAEGSARVVFACRWMSRLAQSLNPAIRRIFEMKRFAGKDQRVNSVGREGGFRKTTEDELELTRVARDIADREYPGAVGLRGRRLDGDVVASIDIAYGGMAAIPKRAAQAEAVLSGNSWNEDTVRQAMNALSKDFSPLTDMRASADYRQQTAANLLYRFYLETRTQDALTSEAVNVFAVQA